MNDVGKQEHKEKKAAVILAAGSGRRMNTPVAKQFLDLMGIPVFLHSVRLFDKIADKIVLVTSPDAVEYCQNLLEKEELCAEVIVIAGKSERFLSSMEGVRAASDCDLIMIHDAARACVDMEVIERSIVTSLQVAEHFQKNHKDVLRDIRVTIEKCSHGFNERNFAPVEYTDAKGETSTMFMGVHHV